MTPQTGEPPSPPDSDIQVTTQSLAPGGVSVRALRRGVSALLLGLIVAWAGWSVWQARPTASNREATAPFAYPTATLLPPLLPSPGTGWVNAGPTGADSFAQSVTDPLTAYTCNAPKVSQQQTPVAITLGVSQDAGVHWSTRATPARGVTCELSSNPTDEYDLFLSAEDCFSCTGGLGAQTRLYRTRDGGQSWVEWTLPPPSDVTLGPLTDYTDHWAGADFFLSGYVLRTQSWPSIAVSRKGAAFVWTDTAYLTNTPEDVSVNAYYTVGTSLYMQLASPSQALCVSCQHVWRTTDAGHSWQVADLPGGAGAPVLIADTSDGLTLLGHTGEGPGQQRLWQSHTGGQTWQAFPAFPANTLFDFPLDERAGVLYEAFQFTNKHIGIYILRTGDHQWQLIGAEPSQGTTATWVLWNQQGIALSLWGQAEGADPPLQGPLQRYTLSG